MNVSDYSNLRKLISSVRSCKTNAEERAKVHRESATIRASFKENSLQSGNMMKLMYISMLGYSTEFAQMEIVNLISHPDFGEKRTGYLTLAVLLNETHEVLTLAENYIKKDLINTNPFIQSLALGTIANVAGEDMSRDVLNEILNLLGSSAPNASNTVLKKKACLAALRIVRKVPEFSEAFLDKLHDVFSERQHGVLICALSLLVECLQLDSGQMLDIFRRQVPQAVRLLKQLVLSSTAQEHDINGIADPFLQVLLMKFLRIVGRANHDASEAMNDILAQVATNTESGKNAGCAILYDCARTIFAIESDAALRVLGINILTRFLSNQRDNNLRFVALSTLRRVFERDPEAIQAHKGTIIECLKDVDVSIRRRALDLTVALIDESNVRILVPDLLAYILSCTEELRNEVTEKVCQVIESASPTPEWRIEMSLRLLRMARAQIPEKFALQFITFIADCNHSSQLEVAQGLWDELSQPLDSQMQQRLAFLLCALWCIGEFIDILVERNRHINTFAEEVTHVIVHVTSAAANCLVKNYGLNAIAKIASRHESALPLALQTLEMHASSLDCEIQQRACEYIALLDLFNDLGKFCLGRMAQVSSQVPSIAFQGSQLPTKPSSRIVDDLFGDEPLEKQVLFPLNPPKVSFLGHKANDVQVDFDVAGKDVSDFSRCHVTAHIRSFLQTPADRFQFLVAVPKTTTVEVKPLAASVLPSMGTLSQEFDLAHSDPAWNRTLMLKIRLIYFVDGVQRIEQFQVSKELA